MEVDSNTNSKELNSHSRNFNFFNDTIKEQISSECINAESPQEEEEEDRFNYYLKKSLERMLDNLLILKQKLYSNDTKRDNHYFNTFPTIASFQLFIKDLFEIVHSPEKLNFALKFIIDTVLEDEIKKYDRDIIKNFVNKLICSNSNKFYPADYLDDSVYISKFCQKYILLSKSNSNMLSFYQKSFSLTSMVHHKKSPLLFDHKLNTSKVKLSTFLDKTDVWSHLISLVSSLKLDKTVLVNGYYSDIFQKTIFNDIKDCVINNNINEADFIKYLLLEMSNSLSRDESNLKTPNGDWKYIVVFLKQHSYFKEYKQLFKDFLVEDMVKVFQNLANSYKRFSQQQDDVFEKENQHDHSNYKRKRFSKPKFLSYSQIDYDADILKNESYALVALTLVEEGLLDLNEFMETFSKVNQLNQELKGKLICSYDKFLKKQQLNQNDNYENALAGADVLTTESDSLKTQQTSSRFSNFKEEKSVSPFPSDNAKPINDNDDDNNNSNKDTDISLNLYPQIVIICQLLERASFDDAIRYIEYFNYSLLNIKELANTFCYCLQRNWICIRENSEWQENSINKRIININSTYNFPSKKYTKKWEYWGSLKTPVFSKEMFLKHFTRIFNMELNDKTVEKLLKLISELFRYYKTMDDYDENYWISFTVQYLVPKIIINSPDANNQIYKIIESFSINKRFEIYKKLESSIIKNNQHLKTVNTVQLKQIKRFLKIINVDTISEQSVELSKLANVNPITVFEECLKQAESYDMISSLIVESVSGFSSFTLDVLQYSCLKRLQLDRPYMAADEVNVLPWLAKLTTFIVSVYNLNSFFNIDFIFNNVVEKTLKMEYQGLYILKEFLSKTTNSVYLDEPEYNLAVLLEASNESSVFAKTKLLGHSNKTSSRLLSLFKQKTNQDDITVAQKLFEILIIWPLDIFYDSFQLVSSINSKYDSINTVLRLMIDFIKSSVDGKEFQCIFNLDKFNTALSVSPLISNSWRHVLFSKTSDDVSYLNLDINDELTTNLVKDFWRYSLENLALGALKFTNFTKFNLSSTEKSYNKICNILTKHTKENYPNEGLKYFLEECVLKNSIMGVAEAIYSVEFMFLTLSSENLIHVLTMLFTRDFLKRVLISISTNETLFFSVFINRIFIQLNNYESSLNDDQINNFKKDYLNWTKSFVFEISELILDNEYLNSRAAIQIISKSIHSLPDIDILIDILLKAINDKLIVEDREELIAPLTSLNGFAKTKFKKCHSVETYLGYIPEDQEIDTMIATMKINEKLEEMNVSMKEKDDQLVELEEQQKKLLQKIEEKRERLKKEAEAKKIEEAEEKEREEVEARELEIQNKRKLEDQDSDTNVIKRRKFDYGSEAKPGVSRFEGSMENKDNSVGVVIVPKGRFGGTVENERSLPTSPASRLALPSGPKLKLPAVQESLNTSGMETRSEKLLRFTKPPINHTNLNPEKALLILENILKADKFSGVYISKLFAELDQVPLTLYLIDQMRNNNVDLIEYFTTLIQKIFIINYPSTDYSRNIKKIISQVWVSLNFPPTAHQFVKKVNEHQTPSKLRYDPYRKESFIEQVQIHKRKINTRKPHDSRENKYSYGGESNRRGNNDSNQSRQTSSRFASDNGNNNNGGGSRFNRSEKRSYGGSSNIRNNGYRY
ncbi:hypothetical protein ACO0SA_001538 [Hanseniaspora valbyensis]